MRKLIVAHYVCFDKKFIPNQIEFLNKQFSDEIDQTFYVQGAPDSFFQGAPDNVVSLNKANFIRFIFAAHKADRLIFNGLFYKKIVLFFSFMPWLLGKALWLPWGGDLYWRLYGNNTTKSSLFIALKGWFVRHLYGIATPTYGDYATAIKWYGNGPKYINAGCNIFDFELADLNQLVADKSRNLTPRIQIGNSGDPTNEHIEIIEMLSRFSGLDMEIFVPLTYGNKEYIDEVIAKGKALFGDKFIPLTQFMSPDKYNNYLASIDVVIFNHRRQQGFGNLVISLYLGAKVFIRKDVSTWEYLMEGMGCLIHDTNSISEIDFQKLLGNSVEIIQKNRAAVAHLFDRQWQKDSWARLYFE